MEVNRVVGLKAGLGSILYLESARSPRCSLAIRVNRKALCVASMRSLRSFFFFAYFSRASRCDRPSLTSKARARARFSRSARYAAESFGFPSLPPGIRNKPGPEGMTRDIFVDAGDSTLEV